MGSQWVGIAIDDLTAACAAAGDVERAAGVRRYVRDQFAFLGVVTPERRMIAKRLLARRDSPTPDDIEAIGQLAWATHEHELQYAAVDVLVCRVKSACGEFLDVVAELATTNRWWDTVDALAPIPMRCLGSLATTTTYCRRWRCDRPRSTCRGHW